jgi:hypothetical protein
MHLVSSATQGRALLREYSLDTKPGGPVEIKGSYDRYEINPRTGRRKGYRERKGRRQKERLRSDESSARSAERSPPTPAPSTGNQARHAPIKDLVSQIRRETNAAVPDVDPDGPGWTPMSSSSCATPDGSTR